MFPNWGNLIGNSIHLLVEGHYGSNIKSIRENKLALLRHDKDIIVPGGGDLIFLKKTPELEREYFVSYCGSTNSSVERKNVPIFLENLKKKNVHIVLRENCSKAEFLSLFRKSKYCLAPAGKTPWTSRLYGAIAQGCVPVLFNLDTFVPPFGKVSAFNELSVRLSIEKDVEENVEKFISNDYLQSRANLNAFSAAFHPFFSYQYIIMDLKRKKCRETRAK